ELALNHHVDVVRIREGVRQESKAAHVRHVECLDAVADAKVNSIGRRVLPDGPWYNLGTHFESHVIERGVRRGFVEKLRGGKEIRSRLLDPLDNHEGDGSNNQQRTQRELGSGLHSSIIMAWPAA